MLPAYIIEELHQREHATHEEQQRPQLYLELPQAPTPHEETTKKEEESRDSGVVIISIWDNDE